MRPFRFLADDIGGRRDAAGIGEHARLTESLGYSALVIPDHLVDQLAPLPYLAVAAAATERLRIGTFVLNNDLRHPAVLAQDLATLDAMSGGRLEIGIGAGWNVAEYRAIGISFEPAARRSARLAEAVTVLKGCFAGQAFDFAGEHYRLTGHEGRPLPVQQPHPPLLIGGGGRRTLTLAAREADIVGLAPRISWGGGGPMVDPASLTVEAADEKVAWVREAAGDRFASLELNLYPSQFPPLITDRARAEATDRAAAITARTGRQITADALLDSPHQFLGTVDAICDKLIGLRERLGVSSFMLGDAVEMAPIVERLAGR
ncbi:MAG TPA: TIGR03621 family F420-dependent LLM class oxidoreductase [Candidatus Limnocylindrales bacterium]|jgi:probable F420-dependent oxidoreductase